MRTINTAEIMMDNSGERLDIGSSSELGLSFGNNKMQVTDTCLELSDTHRLQIQGITDLCIANFNPSELTLVRQSMCIPTLLARVDCTIVGGSIKAFECDERPAGIGVSDTLISRADGIGIKSRVLKHLINMAGDEPVVLKTADTGPNDDQMVFEVRNLSDTPILDRPVMLRGEPDDLRHHPRIDDLIAASVAPIVTEGDKSYSLGVGVMESVIAEVDLLPDAGSSFAIKPRQGSKAKGVKVYLSPVDRKNHGKHGTVTHSKITNSVAEAQPGSLICENFKPPILAIDKDGNRSNMILRIFSLISPGQPSQVIGGSFVSRPELVVHGASNALSGAVLIG